MSNQVPDTLDGTHRWSETCGWCAHRLYGEADRRCKAFPDGIPLELWRAQGGHREPYPGDQGIQFEEIPHDPTPPAEHFEIPEFLKRK